MTSLPGAKSRYETGERAGDFVAKLADGAANFACGLYRDFPGALINPVPVPLRDVGAGFMDSLCGSRRPGLPPTPSPLNNGQCECVLYNLTFVQTNFDSAGNPTVTNRSLSAVPGKILGVQKLPNSGTGDFYDWKIIAGSPTCPFSGFVIQRVQPSTTVVLTGAVRADGQPDNCGLPPRGFPDATIPPSRTSGNVTINKNDGANITIPIVYAPITPTLEISPRFNFDLGGIRVSFDAGGVTINNVNNPSDPINRDNGQGNLGDNITNLGDNVTNLGDNITNLGDTINNINDTVNDIKNDPRECPEFDPTTTIPDPKTEDDPKEESNDPDIESVQITITRKPRNARTQSGAGSPDVLYSGWFEWRRGTFSFPREPIHFEQSIFKNMVGADGFAYTVYEGFRAKHTVNRKPDAP